MRRLALVAMCAGSIWAADAKIDLPVIGHVFDPNARGLRAVVGIPGSARMTDVLSFDGAEFGAAWIAPGRSYGLAAGADGKLYRFDTATRSVAEVAAAAPEQVTFSPNGTAAALSYSTGHVRVLLNMESSSVAGMEIDLTSGATGLAISDDGAVLMAIVARENGRSLTAFTIANAERVLLSAPGLKEAAFLFGSRDAAVSDDAEGKIYIVRGSGELAVLAQVEEATALAVARDNSRIFVASSPRRSISSIGISDGVRSVSDCACVPGVFNRLQEDVFGVSSGIDGPLWLFNGAASENRFTFVPQPEGVRE